VSGLMIANHTSIHTLFERVIEQYEKLRKRNAFLDGYKKDANIMEEFESSRESVAEMIREYKAAEKSDYLEYGNEEGQMEEM
jgi:tubulin gamma